MGQFLFVKGGRLWYNGCNVPRGPRSGQSNKGKVITMAELLETIMLLCFGFSWPVSLYKNFKARSAKGMSLYFILLILLGYVAGISAKLINRNYTYVLAVYLFNLVMVSANLVTYFRNRALDKRAETGTR